MVGETGLHKLKWIIWLLSIVIFAISLACPTFCTSDGCDGIGGGLFDLMFGWMGALIGGSAYLSWLANPFFLIAVLSKKKYPWLSLVMSIFALTVALSFLRGGQVVLNEAGHKAYIISFQIGYWLWLLSMLFMLFASILSIMTFSKRIDHHIDE